MLFSMIWPKKKNVSNENSNQHSVLCKFQRKFSFSQTLVVTSVSRCAFLTWQRQSWRQGESNDLQHYDLKSWNNTKIILAAKTWPPDRCRASSWQTPLQMVKARFRSVYVPAILVRCSRVFRELQWHMVLEIFQEKFYDRAAVTRLAYSVRGLTFAIYY